MTRTPQHTDVVASVEVQGPNGPEHRRVRSVTMIHRDPDIWRTEPELRAGEMLVEVLGGPAVVIQTGY